MPAIKLQAYKGTNDGSVSCDYRGELFIGSEHDPRRTTGDIDHHRTIAEIDPASEEQLAWWLEHGPTVNAGLRDFGVKSFLPSALAEALGDFVPVEGMRVGIFDE